jgi:5-methyltetrahydropteroyltriglutamate--homocysteine methyltransferase
MLQPIATTTIGSFPRPTWLYAWGPEGRPTELIPRFEGEAFREACDDATLLVLREQEDIGIDLVTDGEQRRTGFVNHILAGLRGFDLERRHGKAIRNRTRERLVPIVADKVRREGSVLGEDLRFAKAHTNRPIKMAAPGPSTVVDTTYDEAYGDEAALAMDYAVALNQELLALQAAGVAVLQIDEPVMTRRQEKVADYGAAALDRCLEGITVPTIVHLCYGYPGADPRQHEFTYPSLLEMLKETRVAGYSLEFARSDYDPAILQGCGDRLVMFGCIDPSPGSLESVELVTQRIKSALKYVEPERLMVSPDCGLMMAGRELARQKAEVLVAAAAAVRNSL